MDEKKQYTLYSKVNDFRDYARNYIANSIPNIHRDLKIHLMDEGYNLLNNLLHATYNKGNIKMKYLIELKVNLSMIDALVSDISKLNCIKDNYIKTLINKITDIKNIIYGWIINEEGKKK